MPKQMLLPGYQERLKTFRRRLARLRERTYLREHDFQHIIPELTEDRFDYWRFMGAPTQESLSLLSQVFNVPLEYLWPPMPDDGVRLDRDRIRQEIMRFQKTPPRTPEEQEHYAGLLEIEARLSGIGYITFNLNPTPKLVCILQRLPLRIEDLPGWTDVWDGGAMVLPLEGVKPTDPVYAFRLPARTGEFEGGTTVVFVPLYTDPEPQDLVIGVRRQLPHIALGKDWPSDGTPLGRIVMSLRRH